MRVAFIRHGLTQWNRNARIQGRTDIPLNDEGREQVRGWRLPVQMQSAEWYVSPLRRARETAELLGCSAAALEPRLVEMDWGDWEGESLRALRAQLGEAMAANERRGLDFRPPGGESIRDVQERVLQWCADVAAADDDAIAVTHKGVIRAVYAAAVGWDMREPPAHALDWQCAHVFQARHDGRLSVDALNVNLRPEQ